MGCAASFQGPFPDSASEENINVDPTSTYMSMKWRHMPTASEAKARFLADNTLKEGEVNDLKIELRTLLDDPFAQHALGFYANNQYGSTSNNDSNGNSAGNASHFMCWCDVQEFKCIPSESYRRSKALHIYHKYIKGTAVLALQFLSDEERLNFKSLLDASKDDERILKDSFYNELQYQCFVHIFENIYIPFKKTPDYISLQTHLMKKYNRVKLSHFTYYDVLGEGGFGLVLHCKKKSTGKHYAMKLQTKCGLLRHYKDCPEKVYTERMAFASCQHPFIVNLDYAFQTEALAILVLDLATGGDLAQVIKQAPQMRLEEERVKFYSAEIVLALSYLHEMNLVYRDLKPQNVLLHEDGHIQLADLGGILDQSEENLLTRGSRKLSDEAMLPLLTTSIYRPSLATDNGDKRTIEIDGCSIHSAGNRASVRLQQSRNQQLLHQGNSNGTATGDGKSAVTKGRGDGADSKESSANRSVSFQSTAAPAAAVAAADHSHEDDGFAPIAEEEPDSIADHGDLPAAVEAEKDGSGSNSKNSSNHIKSNSHSSGDAKKSPKHNNSAPKRKLSIMGTMGYMAPEMVLLFSKHRKMYGDEAFNAFERNMANTKKLKKRLYNRMVDYWSLGITIYVMFCGRRPFHEDAFNGLIEMDSTQRGALQENLSFKEYTMLFRKIEYPPHMSAAARDLVRRLLDVNPEQRLGATSSYDIRKHAFFAGVDWALLEQRHVQPPHKPTGSFLDKYSNNIGDFGGEFGEAYSDFDALMEENGKQSWLAEFPDAEGQKKFTNWNFTSAKTIRVESGLAEAMDQYDRNFKVQQIMGTIDQGNNNGSNSNTRDITRPPEYTSPVFPKMF